MIKYLKIHERMEILLIVNIKLRDFYPIPVVVDNYPPHMGPLPLGFYLRHEWLFLSLNRSSFEKWFWLVQFTSLLNQGIHMEIHQMGLSDNKVAP